MSQPTPPSHLGGVGWEDIIVIKLQNSGPPSHWDRILQSAVPISILSKRWELAFAKMPTVHLLDYVAGNVRSLVNAINQVGYEVEWVRSPSDLKNVEVRGNFTLLYVPYFFVHVWLTRRP